MILDKEELEEYEDFITHHERGHFLQSKEWANIKDTWINEIIIIRDEYGKIKGTMSVLIRVVPIIKRAIMYSPRGPVYDMNDKRTFRKIVQKVKELAKKYKAFIFRMDPDIQNNNEEFIKLAKECKFRFKKLGMDKIMQPKCVFRLNIENKKPEEVFNAFSSKTRYNIRLAEKKGVKVKEGNRDDLKLFYDILKETSQRDVFFVRKLEYFEKIYNNICIKHGKLLIADYLGEPIAAILPIYYANKAWYLYGGSKNKHRNVMPNYLLQWIAIKIAIEKGGKFYDFRGMLGCKGEIDSPGYGLYKFKKGFAPDLVEFVDEAQIVFNPIINLLFNIIEKIYRNTIAKIVLKKVRIKEKTKTEKNVIKESETC